MHYYNIILIVRFVSKNEVSVMVEYAFKTLIIRNYTSKWKVQEKDLCSSELCKKSKLGVSLKSQKAKKIK